MLRQARPKSQPPIKFCASTTGNRNADRNWPGDIAAHKAINSNVSSGIVGGSGGGCKSALLAASELEELSSTSSSSNSSLASSSLSLSTNSSTSTVLNTLQLDRQLTSKSLIARYAASNSNKQAQSDADKLQQKQSSQNKLNAADSSALTSDEDDPNQTLSSASSSSSGLSSMNSQAASTSSSAVAQTNNSVSPVESQHMKKREKMQDAMVDAEVSECLSDLIKSVVDEHEQEIVEYGSFKLNEVILAETRSSTTTASSGDDTDGHSPVVAGSPSNLLVLPSSRQSSTNSGRADQLVTPVAGVRLVVNFVVPQGRQASVLQAAWQQVNAMLASMSLDSKRKHSLSSPMWLAALHQDERAIEWRQLDTESGHRTSSGRVGFEQIIDCQVERQLVVWTINATTGGHELETTLDDIALALDELPSDASHQKQQVEALVWLCSKESEARMFGDGFRSAQNDGAQSGGEQKNLHYLPTKATATSYYNNDETTTVSGVDDRVLSTTSRQSRYAGLAPHQQQVEEDEAQLINSETKSSSSSLSSSSIEPMIERSKTAAEAQVSLKLQKKKSSSSSSPASTVHHHQQQQQLIKSKQKQTQQTRESSVGDDDGQDTIECGRAVESGGNSQLPRDAPVQSSRGHRNHKADESRRPAQGPFSSAESLGGKRVKKSASGLDLSSLPAGDATLSSASSSSPAQAGGLASYYRSVASKVISNGQSRIKSFRDEMIRLNSRMPAASAATTKRISMVLQPSLSSSKCNGRPITGSALDLSSVQTTTAQPATNVTPNGHQQSSTLRRSSAKIGTSADSIIVESNGVASSTGTGKAPAIKPRTSILKSKQQNNGCDINNNGNYCFNSTSATQRDGNQCNANKADQLVKQRQVSGSQKQLDTTSSGKLRAGEVSASSLRCKPHAVDAQSATKKQQQQPKSILKASKSVCDIVAANKNGNDTGRFYLNRHTRDDDDDDNNNNNGSSSKSKAAERVTVSGPSGQKPVEKWRARGEDEADEECDLRSSISKQKTRNTKRHSTYSMVMLDSARDDCKKGGASMDEFATPGEGYVEDAQIDDEDEEDERVREKAFDRIRQRASCYDISRLMSKGNSLQSQLSKLRTGSTCCSIAVSKTRQRRPALLIQHDGDDERVQDDADNDDDDELEAEKHRARSDTVIHLGDADGTVRAQVKSHTQSAASDSSPATIVGGRRQMRLQSQSSSRVEVIPSVSGAERYEKDTQSEFDPRSLRQVVPAKTAMKQQPAGSDVVPKTSDSGFKKGILRRKSMTSVRLLREDAESSTARGETRAEQAENRTGIKVSDDWVADEVDETEPDTVEVDQVVARDNNDIDEDDEEDEDEDAPAAAEEKSVSSAPLSKFSLLRQSFNQKTLSSMLKFSGRASLRVKSAAATPAPSQSSQATKQSAGADGAAIDKASAIAIAAANLLAAKQLKQQAQRLKEQQKREQQQAVVATLDPTSIMMAAVQYNQQLQRQQQQHQQHQQQQQQQQMIYHQYAVAARGQMFDASAVHLQHQQMMIQRQQHQQMAYMANLNSHYMAQQMAIIPAPMAYPVAQPAPLPPPVSMVAPVAQSHPRISSILKGVGGKQAVGANEMMYQHQAHHHHQTTAATHQQLIPMSVNHHSSFNIVYAPGGGQLQQHQQQQQAVSQVRVNQQQPAPVKVDSSLAKRRSSLGASMRKTVKSILINRSPASKSSAGNDEHSRHETPKLKSALKQPAARTAQQSVVLDSEGSDGDGSSSSDSATTPVAAPSKSTTSPKSALKKSPSQQQVAAYSTSSDSSCSSSDLPALGYIGGGGQQVRATSKTAAAPLTRGQDYRQSVKVNGQNLDRYYNGSAPSSTSSTLRASKRSVAANSGAATMGRKNVTFSAKLTSIS